MSTYRTKGIVISRRALQENNRVYILYTEGSGKLEAIARGSRKIKSKLAPHLEPPTLVDLMIARGKKIDKLAGAMAINTYPKIRSSFLKIQIVFDCIRVLHSLTYSNQKDEKIWGLLEKFLQICENTGNLEFDEKAEILKNVFLMKLLAFLGYKPEIKQCVLCKKNRKPFIVSGFGKEGIQAQEKKRKYFFDYIKGGLVCGSCRCNIYTDSFVEIDENSLQEMMDLLGKRFDEVLNSPFKLSENTKKVINYLVKNQQDR